MKSILLITSSILILSVFSACTKCGHCETKTRVTGGQYTYNSGSTFCGDFAKAEEINCDRANKSSDENTTYTWVDDK